MKGQFIIPHMVGAQTAAKHNGKIQTLLIPSEMLHPLQLCCMFSQMKEIM